MALQDISVAVPSNKQPMPGNLESEVGDFEQLGEEFDRLMQQAIGKKVLHQNEETFFNASAASPALASKQNSAPEKRAGKGPEKGSETKEDFLETQTDKEVESKDAPKTEKENERDCASDVKEPEKVEVDDKEAQSTNLKEEAGASEAPTVEQSLEASKAAATVPENSNEINQTSEEAIAGEASAAPTAVPIAEIAQGASAKASDVKGPKPVEQQAAEIPAATTAAESKVAGVGDQNGFENKLADGKGGNLAQLNPAVGLGQDSEAPLTAGQLSPQFLAADLSSARLLNTFAKEASQLLAKNLVNIEPSATQSRANGNVPTLTSVTALEGKKSAAGDSSNSGSRLAKAQRITPNNILERVEQVVRDAQKSRDGKSLSFRLDPPNLGTLKVDVSLREGILQARLSADSTQVQHLLRDKAHELQGNLRRLGLEVDQVIVSVRGDSVDGGTQEKAGGQGQNPEKQQKSFMNGAGEEFGTVVPESANLLSEITDHWII